MVVEQGGDASYILDPSKWTPAKEVVEVRATESGYVTYINALEIGVGSMMLGGGRETMKDVIDMSVGVILNKKIDDYVNSLK